MCLRCARTPSSGVSLAGLTTRGGGWFTILATNTEHLTISGLTIHAARDAMDIMGCRHVLITGMNISGGGDDAVKFGSDFSRGRVLESYDVNVTNSAVGSNGCNALQFGSETVGDFHDYRFENISVTKAGKAGIGIVSMDGSHIYNIVYKNITMVGATTPLCRDLDRLPGRADPHTLAANVCSACLLAPPCLLGHCGLGLTPSCARSLADIYIGGRLRRPPAGLGFNDTLVGAIRDITVSNVRVRSGAGSTKSNWTATIEGQPADATVGLHDAHWVGPNIALSDVVVEVVGGGRSADAGIVPPHPSGTFPPRSLGHRPSYGMFIRRATGVSLSEVGVRWAAPDGRPPFILAEVDGVGFGAGVEAEASSPPTSYDIGLRENCTGVTVSPGSKLVVKNISGVSGQ